MKYVLFFGVVLFFSCLFVNSQSKNTQPGYLQWYDEAELLYNSDSSTNETDEQAVQLYNKTLEYLKQSNADFITQADCYKKIGNIYLAKGEFKKASDYYKLLMQAQGLYGYKAIEYNYQARLYLGSAYYQSNNIDSARYYFEAASAYVDDARDLPDISFLYNSLGVIYFESANYMQAKNYFEKAYPDDDSLELRDPETYVTITNNIATCLKLLGYRQEALNMYNKLLRFDIITERIYYNIGNAYFLSGQYDSAVLYYDKISANADAVTTVRKLNDIGRILTEKQNWQLAEKIFDSAIDLNTQIIAIPKNKELAYSYFYKAILAGRQGLTDEAIAWCNNAIQVLHFNFKWKNLSDLPEDETRVISPIIFFEVLQEKAKLLETKYKSGRKQLVYEICLDTYMEAIRVASYIKSNFDNDEAGYFFKENYKEIYYDAIKVAYDLSRYYNAAPNDKFLQVMESYKGSILYYNFKKLEIKHTGKIPQQILETERRLKQSLASYSSVLNNTDNPDDADSLEKKMTEVKVEISRLQKLYEKYPAYEVYKRQGDANSITVKDIRKKLDENTAVISFLYTPEYIYGLAITRKTFVTQRISVTENLEQHIQTLLSALYDHTEGHRYAGYDASAAIYDKLIKPFYPTIEDKKRWVVLPDGILNFLPFNALQIPGSNRNFLAENRIISNHYSLLLLLSDGRDISQDLRNQVLFAPFVGNTANVYHKLPVLASSADEAAAFKGNNFINEKATKSSFLHTAKSASVIHLATHATAGIDSVDDACIYFYPVDSNRINARLYMNEIYNLELPGTRLVILSACETAKGKNLSGEGLFSLARAFLYAGSDGVISTFWKTEDKISAYIMNRLHYYLQQNKTPEEALHLAKKDFLKSEQFDEHFKTPNYWANFIYIGDLKPMDDSILNISVWWWVLLLVCSVALLWVLEKRKRLA